MIVTCAECSTSFQLDEARIPATGAQVRCSRCKHAFFLANPSASQTESAHEIASAAAADPSAGVPAPSTDLRGIGRDDEPEEEEWQFSEEVRVEGDEERFEESSLEGESDLGLGEDFGEGLDADSLSEDVDPRQPDASHIAGPPVVEMAAEDDGTGSGLELDSPRAPVVAQEPARDESSFGSVDDFSSLMEDDESASPVAAAESSAVIDQPCDASPGSYASGGTTDDLGDPESWDLIGGSPALVAPSGGKRKAPSPPSAASAALDGALAELAFTSDEDSLAYDEDREPSAFATLVGKFGNVVGWVGTLAALVFVTSLLVGSEFSRWADAPQAASFGSLRAETNEMHWMETARSGFVLVMRGEVENAGAEAILPVGVRLWLLDGAGERLAAPPLQVGTPLAEEVLREAGLAGLGQRLDASAEAFAVRTIAPGESLSFEAVVLEEALPKRARRILLEVADPNAETPAAAEPVKPRSLIAPEGATVENSSGDPDGAVVGTHDHGTEADAAVERISDLLELDD